MGHPAAAAQPSAAHAGLHVAVFSRLTDCPMTAPLQRATRDGVGWMGRWLLLIFLSMNRVVCSLLSAFVFEEAENIL
jgi:hypothetical protein